MHILLVLPVQRKYLSFRRCGTHLLSHSSLSFETQYVSHYQSQNHLIALHITSPTGRMALTPSFPVLVLMKSLPAIMHTKDAFEWFYDRRVLIYFVKVFYERVNDIPCRHWSYYPALQWPRLTSCELNHMLPDAVCTYVYYIPVFMYIRITVVFTFSSLFPFVKSQCCSSPSPSSASPPRTALSSAAPRPTA